MYQHQASLPKIPIAKLEDTMQRYIDGVTPLVSAEQLAQTKKYVEEFMTNPAWGPHLQQQLTDLDQASTTNFIEGFWDSMYLDSK